MAEFDYHLHSVNDRLDDLLIVLQYDNQVKLNKDEHFTTGERILINYERSAMRSFRNYLFKEIEHSQINWYKVPETIENKIIKMLTIISQTDWQPKPYEDEY